jgi:Ca-activated chloride channel family protein
MARRPRPVRVLHLVLVLAGALALGVGLSGLLATAGDSLTRTLGGQEVTLQDPRWLWALMLLPWIWVVPAAGLSDLPRWQQVVSALVRSAVIALVIAALCRTSLVSREERVATIVLADVSDSVPDAFLRASEAWIRDARRAAPDRPLAVVSFAEQPRRVPLPTSEGGSFLQRHAGAGRGTDFEAALKMAYGLFPPEHLKRAVILSDGHETDGDALAEAPAAAEQGVEVGFATLDVAKPAEVMVRGLKLPELIEVRAAFTLRAELFSTGDAEAKITLWQDDYKQAGPRTVTLSAGVNEVEFPVTVHEPGFKRFRLEAVPAEGTDSEEGNNVASATAVVSGNPRVLLVEGEPSAADYLARALRKQQIDVEVRGPHGVPTKLSELEDFDLFILSDVPATAVTAKQMELIDRYVRELGGGFLMAGGENSFGLGGYYRTAIERLLPVRFEIEKKRETPSLAIILCIDKSGSMSGQKIDLAKDAAQATVELLSKHDQVGVLAFDSHVQSLVRLQSARNRVRIQSQIRRLSAGGGTNIKPALEEAYRQLRSTEARLKHIILLSDGQSQQQGIPQLVGDMSADSITISSVAVGAGADRNLLSTIADLGGGRSYFTNDPFNIPKIFTKETQTVARNALVEEPFRPRPVKRAQFLRGIPMARAPYLLGYVSTRAKKGAEVLLESERGEPILARWRQGLGLAAVWTADLKNRWAVEWVRWAHWTKFWSQLTRDLMRRTNTDGLELTASVRPDGKAHVVLDALTRDDRWRNDLAPVLEVIDPAGASSSLPLHQSAAGRYEATFALPRYGAYLLNARPHAEAKRTATLRAGLANPYPREHLTVGSERKLLARLATATGGKADIAPATAFDSDGRTIRFEKEVRAPFLLAALFLFLLDLLLRRIRLGRAGEVAFT